MMETDEDYDSYRNLDPSQILDAVESTGLICDGRIFALNSYENRVYQVGIEDSKPVIAKFYRPGRWSDEAILEEHAFTIELLESDIPVVAPQCDEKGNTLHRHRNFRFVVYPRQGGRPPEPDQPEQLIQLGRFIGMMHNVGATRLFTSRPNLDLDSSGRDASKYILENGFMPQDLETAYSTLCEDLDRRIRNCIERTGDYSTIRLHGDCHPSNILWFNNGPVILDFDDARSGPAIQDLWMFLSGERQYATARLADLLEGYTTFRDFDARELHLIEALRSLRIMNYAAWIARRWDDPAFPLAFPQFNTRRYWEEQILSLREQAALMDEPPLEWTMDR